ncbi:peptide ABC transporter substrate-binding protein [Arsenophonus sp. ENCA]|uniref:peptide ABC transporter substrate-binding protein n=1 Tax=Arsenophonus sp. ENCA TaxID=1987579 RepID=UPI0025C33BBB|nr:peptide ABC transporter substrate-binding protein [Arsenophonus sp. ENCA]
MEIYMLRYRTALAIFFLNCIVNTKSAVAALVVRGDLLAEKQEIVRQINADPTYLDPISNVGLAESHVIRDLFVGLTNQNEAGSPIPGVANRWTTAGNRIWFFYLRPNAKWSNGDPVTAKDFVYSWRRLVDPVNNSPFAYFATLAGIKNAQKIINNELPIEKLGVEAIDNHTLKVTLEQPAPFFLNLTNHFSFFPVNQKIIARYGQNWVAPTNLVGNGAFMLSERIAGEKIVLQPNRHYWDHKNTILTKGHLEQLKIFN